MPIRFRSIDRLGTGISAAPVTGRTRTQKGTIMGMLDRKVAIVTGAARGLGRAYALSGDSAKAKASYQGFLTLWKDADPDIPILMKAKAEYAKFQ